MDLLLLSFISAAVCVLLVFSLKYLSLLRWVSGNAYVLSKKKDHFSILEILDLFRNVRPFPISNQKGWKIDSYAHSHRVWFNFLTFPHHLNAPSIKVFAVFDRVGSSSQALLHVLRDIGQTCDWKPGVMSTSHTHTLRSHEVPNMGLPSMPVQADCIKEERLVPTESKFSLRYHDPWFNENVISTESVDCKRFWHREDNGVCWHLQMTEKLQTCEFYLIQPVSDVEQCLLSVVTWSRVGSRASREKASILLSSLQEYMSVRRLQKTPLLSITLPQDESASGDSTDSSGNQAHASPFSSFKKLILDKESSSSSDSNHPKVPQGHVTNQLADFEKYSSILRYKSKTNSRRGSRGLSNNNEVKVVNGSATSASNNGAGGSDNRPAGIQRSVSDGSALMLGRQLNREVLDEAGEGDEAENNVPNGLQRMEEGGRGDGETGAAGGVGEVHQVSQEALHVALHKTLCNQSAAELLAEAVRASNIDLQLTSDQQAQTSGGWLFSSFEKNIVILKKLQSSGSTVQSYIGKGFVLAPPRTVWDAVRNPRTRFTYDESLKKVDILETIDDTLKVVYYYHESQAFLNKTSCDMCVLQGERQEGDKFVLTYSALEHDRCPLTPGVVRAKVHPSGWIIEPARQDNRVYSVVTYLMQIDCGPPPDGSVRPPFEDMVSRYPLSIAYLQQYLKPALQMLRRKSLH